MVVRWYCTALFIFSLGQSISYHVWVLWRHMVIPYWSFCWSVDLVITCVDKITLAVVLSWFFHWFLNLFVTWGGRVVGRDNTVQYFTLKNLIKLLKSIENSMELCFLSTRKYFRYFEMFWNSLKLFKAFEDFYIQTLIRIYPSLLLRIMFIIFLNFYPRI